MVEQIVYPAFEGVADYGENERKTRCQPENERKLSFLTESAL